MPLPSAGDWGTPLVVSTSTGKPKPWSTGEVAGTCVDSQDHVFIVTRGNLVNSPETLDSVPAAPVMRIRSRRQRRQRVGRPQRAAQRHPRLLRRLPGQRLDRRQRRRHRAEVHRTTARGCCCRSARAACATNPPTTTPAATRAAIPAANQSKTLLNQPANVYDRSEPGSGERQSAAASTSPTATATTASSCSRTAATARDVAAPVGRRGRDGERPVTDSPGLFASGDGGHPHCVIDRQGRPGLRLRSRRRPHPGLHQDRVRCNGSFRSFPAPA